MEPTLSTSLTQAARSEAGDQQKHVTTAVAERFLATGSYDLFASNSPSRNELGPVLRSLDSHDATVVTSGAIWPGYPPQCTCNRHVYTLMSWHRLSLHKTRKSCRKSDLACWSQGRWAGWLPIETRCHQQNHNFLYNFIAFLALWHIFVK